MKCARRFSCTIIFIAREKHFLKGHSRRENKRSRQNSIGSLNAQNVSGPRDKVSDSKINMNINLLSPRKGVTQFSEASLKTERRKLA